VVVACFDVQLEVRFDDPRVRFALQVGIGGDVMVDEVSADLSWQQSAAGGDRRAQQGVVDDDEVFEHPVRYGWVGDDGGPVGDPVDGFAPTAAAEASVEALIAGVPSWARGHEPPAALPVAGAGTAVKEGH
jgi:hypothetical protein